MSGAQGGDRKWLFETSDGGRTWIERASRHELPYRDFVRELVFFDRGHGAMLADNHDTSYVFVTDDGGKTWRDSFLPGSGTIEWSWPDMRNGYAAVRADGVYSTHDLGRTWRRVFPEPGPVGPVSYSSSKNVVGVIAPWGREGRDYRVIFRTSNGGRTWKPSGRIPSGIVSRFIRLSPSVLLAVTGDWGGPFGLLRSDDNGRHWRVLAMPKIGGETLADFLSISFVGSNGLLLDGNGKLYRSHDSGASWQLLNRSGFSSVVLLNQKRALAAPNPWSSGLFSSSDGGRTWERIMIKVSGHKQTASDIAATDPNDIWITTASGLLLRTRDGGANWSAYRLRFDEDELNFVSPDVGFAQLGWPAYLDTR